LFDERDGYLDEEKNISKRGRESFRARAIASRGFKIGEARKGRGRNELPLEIQAVSKAGFTLILVT
jgi:ribosomal protein L34